MLAAMTTTVTTSISVAMVTAAAVTAAKTTAAVTATAAVATVMAAKNQQTLKVAAEEGATVADTAFTSFLLAS